MESRNPQDIKPLLNSAMRYARNVCVLGATNRIDDIVKTNGWSVINTFITNVPGRYHKASTPKPWFFMSRCVIDMDLDTVYQDKKFDLTLSSKVDDNHWLFAFDAMQAAHSQVVLKERLSFSPLSLDKDKLNDDQKANLLLAISAMAKRQGNCHERCALVMKYLWEKPKGIDKIELIGMSNVHAIIVVNREGELSDPNTWGDAWVVDPWHKEGLIFHAKDFESHAELIMQDLVYQAEQVGLTKGGEKGPEINKAEPITLSSVCIVEPAKHPYPRGENEYLSVEDYYLRDDCRFDSIADMEAAKKLHHEEFVTTLTKLGSFKQDVCDDNHLQDSLREEEQQRRQLK